MASWVAGNRGITKEITVEIREGDFIRIRVVLNHQTWRWEASIHEHLSRESLSVSPDNKLTARSPERAAARALEYLLGMADRDELAH